MLFKYIAFTIVYLFFAVSCLASEPELRCDVIYKYADGTFARPNGVWEKDGKWRIDGPNQGSISLKLSKLGHAIFTGPLQDKAQYTVTLSNNYSKGHSVHFTYEAGRKAQTVTITKVYSKIHLLNSQGKIITKAVPYLGPSNILNESEIENNSETWKCPKAVNGGYSIPPIDMEVLHPVSLYILYEGNLHEYSFKKEGWYGKPTSKRITVE